MLIYGIHAIWGVLRGAEFEPAVCPAQKWLISLTNEKFKMAATGVLKLVNVHILFLSKVET